MSTMLTSWQLQKWMSPGINLNIRIEFKQKQEECGKACHWSTSHNKQDKFGNDFQPGGTAILVCNKLSHKMAKPGNDTTGLGQWSWIQLRGKEKPLFMHHLPVLPMQSGQPPYNVPTAHLMAFKTRKKWVSKKLHINWYPDSSLWVATWGRYSYNSGQH